MYMDVCLVYIFFSYNEHLLCAGHCTLCLIILLHLILAITLRQEQQVEWSTNGEGEDVLGRGVSGPSYSKDING